MKNNVFSPIQTRLTGVTFDDCQANIRKWGCPDIGTYALVREPENPHDPNAVRVSLFGIYEMGYLPRWLAKDIAPQMDAGRTFIAEFICRNEYGAYENIGITVRIVETVG
ncbi:hypothetical protein DSCW_60400 [Desulfosarcina widdelii]|uniref:HIRAN domain-containing protein n=1 Tax=Desulfosarcina widdelii TaxID=947919 RepID=A0A5K7ZFY3_9BACT|nr:HIRAN domain-containing protein [Desulfosarcina widdelii]BBO78623.1 hypothetical protein DSCW_60400 [Desulfosarcina widdelii]